MGACDRDGATQGQNAATQPAPDRVGHLLASSEWCEMAISPLGIRLLVDRGPAFHSMGEARRLGSALRARKKPGASHGNGLSLWHEHQGSSQGGGSRQKGGFRERRSDRQALGRSRGGFGSKVCVAADGHGKALSFTLTPGQAHKQPSAMALLDALRIALRYVVCDRGYSSNLFCEELWSKGSRPVIPPQRNEPPVSCPKSAYRHRHLVENLWARLQEWRAVATRYEKTAAAVICIAAAAGYIKT